jgi:hypothetical protein
VPQDAPTSTPAPEPLPPPSDNPPSQAATTLPDKNRALAAWLSFAAGVFAFAAGIFVGYLLFTRADTPSAAPEVAAVTPPKEPAAPAKQEKPPVVVPILFPLPAAPVAAIEPQAVANPPANPVVVIPAKLPDPVKPADKPIVIDPLDNPDRKLDAPNGTAELVELNSDDHITLTGKVKVLKLNAVNGSVHFDASKLEAQEIVLAGEINGNCEFKLNAPNGKVAITRVFLGSCKLTVTAPGGEVILAEGGRIGGGATATLAAKTVDLKGTLNEGAKVRVTLTAPGSLRVAQMDGGATVTYKRSAPGDPEPKIVTGELRSGTRVTEDK